MTTALLPKEKEPDRWERIDRNAGLTGGWLYSVVVSKGAPAYMTGWLDVYFDDEEETAG